MEDIRETQWEIGYESTSIHIDITKIENRIQKCKCRTKYFFIPVWETQTYLYPPAERAVKQVISCKFRAG
jgi:hypothetical protein